MKEELDEEDVSRNWKKLLQKHRKQSMLDNNESKDSINSREKHNYTTLRNSNDSSKSKLLITQTKESGSKSKFSMSIERIPFQINLTTKKQCPAKGAQSHGAVPFLLSKFNQPQNCLF